MNPVSIPPGILSLPSITLVGAGVVGQAILRAHTDAGLAVSLVDQDPSALVAAVKSLSLATDQWQTSNAVPYHNGLQQISMVRRDQVPANRPIPLLIESIPERLNLKRAFFSDIQPLLDPQTVLCSNTSTLRIADLAEGLQRPEQFCGTHFFMPVSSRDAVELIRGNATDAKTVDRATQHIEDLGKTAIVVRDSPGFIVNRLLSPYLNEALTLLCQGIDAERLESAAADFGMPISPLELIDTIGARTMFDAGRVYWQAFPNRIDPSPLLAGLVKSKRMGKHVGSGLFDYDDSGERSKNLAKEALALVDRYRSNVDTALSQADLVDRLSIPMWIEAALAMADGTVTEKTQFDLAMQGGLGYRDDRSWIGFFDDLGSKRILAAIDRWSERTKAIEVTEKLRLALTQHCPSDAMFRAFEN